MLRCQGKRRRLERIAEKKMSLSRDALLHDDGVVDARPRRAARPLRTAHRTKEPLLASLLRLSYGASVAGLLQIVGGWRWLALRRGAVRASAFRFPWEDRGSASKGVGGAPARRRSPFRDRRVPPYERVG